MGKSYERDGFFGKYTEHYDDDGTKIGESREREGFFGRYTEHTDTSGTTTGESREREGFFGKYVEHSDADGIKIGESRDREGFFGRYTEHQGTGHHGRIAQEVRARDRSESSTYGDSGNSSTYSGSESGASSGGTSSDSSGGLIVAIILVVGLLAIHLPTVVATLSTQHEGNVGDFSANFKNLKIESTPQERGWRLFTGKRPFLNGGPPCVNCHRAGKIVSTPKGSDLSKAIVDPSKNPLISSPWLNGANISGHTYPIKKLTDDEVDYLRAFLTSIFEKQFPNM